MDVFLVFPDIIFSRGVTFSPHGYSYNSYTHILILILIYTHIFGKNENLESVLASTTAPKKLPLALKIGLKWLDPVHCNASNWSIERFQYNLLKQSERQIRIWHF